MTGKCLERESDGVFLKEGEQRLEEVLDYAVDLIPSRYFFRKSD